MLLSDIQDPKVVALVMNMLSDGWTLKRVSFCRGYLRVGHDRITSGLSKTCYTCDIFVPNRRTRQKSNRYHAVIRLVKRTDLPF